MKPTTWKYSIIWLIAGAATVICAFAFSSLQAQQADNLHTFKITTSQELKDFFHFTGDRIPLVSSHRGGAREGYPENALATFENTLHHTWSLMEVDPRYTRDSVIVLFHDRMLDRTSTGQGRVSDHTWKELQKLKLKDTKGNVTDYTIPTLDEALEWAKDKTVLFLDNKDVPVAERVKKIQQHKAQSNAVVMAYSFEDAKRIYDLDPDIMMQVFVPDKEAVSRFEKTGIPWENVIAFVTHNPIDDSYTELLKLINAKGVMTVIGTSRTLDQAYTSGKIDFEALAERYREVIRAGADIIEADLGIEAGNTVEGLKPPHSTKEEYLQ